MAALLAMAAGAAQLPDLRIEPAPGGSVFYIRNASAQPLTAWLIELVDYPGSSYALWQDDVAAPQAPGAEKRIPVASMTVGAVPDYVKMQAAIFADGSTAGLPDKIASLIARRRAVLDTIRELIRRMDSVAGAEALAANLKEWADSIQPGRRATQAAVDQTAGRSVIQETLAKLNRMSRAEVLTGLKTMEMQLASSKPAL